MRLIASPLLEPDDYNAIERGEKARSDAVETSLLRQLSANLSGGDLDRFALLSWLIAEGMLEIRLAIPINPNGKYRRGIYHEKIGIFTDEDDNSVAFTGSPNETRGGLVDNFESIDVFWSWDDPHRRVERKIENFDRLWSNETSGVDVLKLPEVVSKKLLEFREDSGRHHTSNLGLNDKPYRFSEGLWTHQVKAVEAFLKHKQGVLEMATGTGKTRTSLAIAERLLDARVTATIVITADGRDLLDQWASDALTLARAQTPPLLLYKQYDKYKELEEFLMEPAGSVLLVSRHFLAGALKQMDRTVRASTFLVHDEVHSLGSPSNRENLDGLSDGVIYKIGLSATPEREYDNAGNVFIEKHIGPTIYRYELNHAIEDQILAPFNYYPLDYMPSENDRERIGLVYKKVAARRKNGNPMSKAEVWTDLARVYKTSLEKLPVFSKFLEQNADVLNRCIIFVETMEFGEAVLDIVHRYKADFHTYYGGEDRSVLQRFARGDLECLVTCHRLSEGIDIQSLRSVILFSSARARLETIQRIGRCLRVDPLDPTKRATIVDFIRADQSPMEDDEYAPTDILRREWLTQLSNLKATP